MNITTKFNIGENVYFIDNNGKPSSGHIQLVDICVYIKSEIVKFDINYHIAKNNEIIASSRVPEKRVFRTKGEIAEYALSLTANL